MDAKEIGGLSLKRGETAAIELSEKLPFDGKFDVAALTVRYKGGEVWRSEEPLAPLPEQKELTQYDRCKKLAEMESTLGGSIKYIPIESEGIWRCACGNINLEGEDACPNCGQSLARLKEVIDEPALKSELEEILAADRAEAAAKAAEKKRKLIKIAAIAAGAIAVLAIAIGIFKWYSAKLAAYDAALALAGDYKYDEAIEAFTELGGFKDSQEQIEIVKAKERDHAFDYATELLNAHRFDSAANAFAAMGDYEGAAEMIPECKYQKALYILSGGLIVDRVEVEAKPDESVAVPVGDDYLTTEDIDFEAVYAIFEELGDYKDSRGYLAGFVTRLVSEKNDENSFRSYYNEEGLEIKRSYSGGSYILLEYENGHIASESFYAKSDAEPYITIYNEHGDVIEGNGMTYEREYYDSGAPLSLVSRNSKGEVTHRRSYQEDGSYEYTNITVKDGEETVTAGGAVTCDGHGNIVEATSYKLYANGKRTEEGYQQTFTYDQNGNVLTMAYIVDGNTQYSYAFEYDAEGRRVKDIKGDGKEEIAYEYDDEGRLVRKTSSVHGYILERTYGLVYCPGAEK